MQSKARKPERWKSANDSTMSAWVDTPKTNNEKEPPYLRQQSFPVNSTQLQDDDVPILDFPSWLEDQLKFSKSLPAPLLDKKKGMMGGFKPFKAISRVGTKKTSCDFYLHVHGVEGLSSDLNGRSVVVRWDRKETMALTVPSFITNGIAEIEQTLGIKCTLYSSGSSSTHRFLPKESTITISLKDPSTVIGKHDIDLAKILPANLKQEHTPFTTSFSLKGKGMGGNLIVTFGYEIKPVKGHSFEARIEDRTWKSYSTPVSARTSAINSPTGSSPDRRFMNQPPPGAFEFKGVQVNEESFDELRSMEEREFDINFKEKNVRNMHGYGNEKDENSFDWELQDVREVSHLQNLEAVKEEEELEEEEEKEEDRVAVEVVKHEDVKELKENSVLVKGNAKFKTGIPVRNEENAKPVKKLEQEKVKLVEKKEDRKVKMDSDEVSKPEYLKTKVEIQKIIHGGGDENDNNINDLHIKDDTLEASKLEDEGDESQIRAIEKSDLVHLHTQKVKSPVDSASTVKAFSENAATSTAIKSMDEFLSPPKLNVDIKEMEKAKKKEMETKEKEEEMEKVKKKEMETKEKEKEMEKAKKKEMETKEKVDEKEMKMDSVQEKVKIIEKKFSSANDSSPLSSSSHPSELSSSLPSSLSPPSPPSSSPSSSPSSPSSPLSSLSLSSFSKTSPIQSLLSSSPPMTSSPTRAVLSSSAAITSPPSTSAKSTSAPVKPSEKYPHLPIGAIGLYSFKKDIGPKPIPIPIPISQKEVLKQKDKDETVTSKTEFDKKILLYSNKSHEIKDDKDDGDGDDDEKEDEEEKKHPLIDENDVGYVQTDVKIKSISKTEPVMDVRSIPNSSGIESSKASMHALPGGIESSKASMHAVPGGIESSKASMHALPGGNLPDDEMDLDWETDMIADEFLDLLSQMIDKEKDDNDNNDNNDVDDDEFSNFHDMHSPDRGIASIDDVNHDDVNDVDADDDDNSNNDVSDVNSLNDFGTSPVFGLLSHADVSQELFLDSPLRPLSPPPHPFPSASLSEEEAINGEKIEIVDFELGESDEEEKDEVEEVEVVEKWKEEEKEVKIEDASEEEEETDEEYEEEEGEEEEDVEELEDDDDDEDDNEEEEESEEGESEEGESEEESEEEGEEDGDMDELSLMIEAAEAEHKRAIARAAKNEMRAKELEEEEMAEQTWIKEKSNNDSSPSNSNPLESNSQALIHPLAGGLFPQDLTLPPLSPSSSILTSPSSTSLTALPPAFGEGMGSAIPLKDGGMLLAMTPKHFVSQQGNLVMQVSKPVVVPEGLGSSAVEIIQHMASIGGDDLAEQARLLMPLDEISGKSIEQMYSEGLLSLEGAENSQRRIAAAKQGQRLAIGNSSSHDPSSYDSALISSSNHGQISTIDSGMVTYGGKSLDSREGRALARALTRGSGDRQLATGQYPQDFVALEEVAPLAVDMIESLAIEGLKIQAGGEEDAPGMLPSLPMSSRRRQKSSHLGSGASVHLLDGRPNVLALEEGRVEEGEGEEGEEIVMDGGDEFGFESMAEDGFMGMAISLDEWQRLDAGMFDEEEMENDTLALLSEHDHLHQQLVTVGHGGRRGLEEEEEEVHGGERSLALRKKRESLVAGRRGKEGENGNGGRGLMGNTVTLAMLVQLRDPLRNYEPVGAPMMALVQAERIVVSPPEKITRRIAMHGDWDKEKEREEREREGKAQGVSKFKITGVHMMGMKGERETWSSKKQNQAGSRWMAASGMSKGQKNSAKKKQFVPEEVKVKPGETLWSISQKMHGSGSKWKDVVRLNPHIRNPDIILPNQKVKLR